MKINAPRNGRHLGLLRRKMISQWERRQPMTLRERAGTPTAIMWAQALDE